MEREMKEVAGVIRSCLLTFKNGTKLSALNAEYRSLEGRNIPYGQLGFQTLESFVRTVPNVLTTRRNGELWTEAVPTKESAHISKLVAGQRSARAGRRKSHLRRFPTDRRSTTRACASLANAPDKRRPSSDTRSNVPSCRRADYSEPRPLLEILVEPPSAVGSARHRYAATFSPETSSPSERMIEKSLVSNRGRVDGEKSWKTVVKSKAAPTAVAPDFSADPSWNRSERDESDTPIGTLNERASSSKLGARTAPAGGTTPKEEIGRMARDLGLGDPVYKVVGAKKHSIFYGQVQIGSIKYNSYPDEARTAIEAENLAAARALSELRNERSAIQRDSPVTSGASRRRRLLEIIGQNAVFVHKLPQLYWQRYNEILPNTWTEEINGWSEFCLETGVNDTLILRRATPSTRHEKQEKSLETTLSGHEKGFLNSICRVEPGHLELPDQGFWAAEVTHVMSTREIWVRPIGTNYNEKLETMTRQMAVELTSKTRTSADETIEPREYYALLENENWFRVRVVEYDASLKEAQVFFIDIGDEDSVDASLLYPLDRKFRSLPAQAMRVSLAGLEDFADCPSLRARIDDYLCGGVFWMETLKFETEENGSVPIVAVVDTRGPDDISVNDLMIQEFFRTLSPKLDTPGQISDAYVCHVDSNGEVFVQVKHVGLEVLVKLLNEYTEFGVSEEERERCALERVESTATYLVEWSETGNWYRGRIVGVAPTSHEDGARRLKIFLIDFGNTIIEEPKKLVQLEKLNGSLASFPAQAIKVALDKVDPILLGVEHFVGRMKECAPSGESLILKVVQPGAPPRVELFKRMSNNILGSINVSLLLESESCKRLNGDGNNNVRTSRQRTNVKSNARTNSDLEDTARALPPPKTAEIGEYFDVRVTMAANPSNFTVQPYQSQKELTAMMKNLQEACIDSSLEPFPNLAAIRVGGLYAVKHVDGDWYRGCVMNFFVDEARLTVYFVDYGDVAIVRLDKLLPLSKQFRQLAYQAIKARLIGVKPKMNDWSPEDCVRFQRLVVERDFVSIVAELDPEARLPHDTVLGLKLIDVSTDDDVYVGEVLVNEGRAVHDR